MTADQIITLLIGLGSGGLIREFGVGLWRWLTGRQEAERNAVQQAWRDLDAETAYRRRIAEHAHELRAVMLDRGIPQGDLPAFPSRITREDNPDDH